MSGREFVKILLAKECITLKELARIATEQSNKNTLLTVFHTKCVWVHCVLMTRNFLQNFSDTKSSSKKLQKKIDLYLALYRLDRYQ